MITEYKCDKCKKITREDYTEHFDDELNRHAQFCRDCSVELELQLAEDLLGSWDDEIDSLQTAMTLETVKIEQIKKGNLKSIEFRYTNKEGQT